MQGDIEHPDSNKFKSATRRSACTSTSNAVINLNENLDEEWFSYEKITENFIRRFKKNLRTKSANSPNNARFTHTTQKCLGNSMKEKCITRDDKSCLKEETDYTKISNNYGIIDEQAAGDKRDYNSSLPMRKSLFPYVSPYVLFHSHNCKCSNNLPKDLTRLLRWKFTASTPKIVMKILLNSGYKMATTGDDWSAVWNPCFNDSARYQDVKIFQKVNSFPGSQNLGNKDVLWNNLNKMREKYGSKEYDFMPKTYVLPKDMKKFEAMWQRNGVGSTWIIKPPSSGRGQGIKVINQWWEIPKWHSVIVQRYISKPRLINGSKFDLRIYVLLTSINPTRIYIYEEGLVRFASVRYVRGTTNLNDKYMHLTNTSVNKQNPDYVVNDGVNSFGGHKWCLKSLWSYLEGEGINVTELWSDIKDIVIKTIIAAEASINATISGNVVSSYTCYELYGFDVLLDENYKPWLLEVNVLPSLQTDSPLDLAIKAPLIRNVLNIAGYQIPKYESMNARKLSKKYDWFAHDYRLYSTTLSLQEKIKQNEINAIQNREKYLNTILENLTRDDLRKLVRYEDEFSQAGNFEKIFPTKNSHLYLQFFEIQRYYDKLFDAWEHHYSDKREEGIRKLKKFCEKMQHLQTDCD